MDILIKSFNRAYYLDRCIASIIHYAKGVNRIRIVDDGTPQKYLDKIKQKYGNNIEIIFSSNYNLKAKLLENNQEINGFVIPVKEWKSVVEQSEKYILVIEDDVWFTDYIDFNEIIAEMELYKIDLVKLGSPNSYKFSYNFIEKPLSKNITAQYPNDKLFLSNAYVMSMIFKNKFKLKSVLCRLGVFNNYTISEYYVLFSILMGLYEKDYWLYLWKNIDNTVDESKQIINAVDWKYSKKYNKNSICKTNKEFLKTTYSSTSTNSYRRYSVNININTVNFVLNELWYLDKIDIFNNMPKDFNYKKIQEIVEDNYPNMINVEDWNVWILEFKSFCNKYSTEID